MTPSANINRDLLDGALAVAEVQGSPQRVQHRPLVLDQTARRSRTRAP